MDELFDIADVAIEERIASVDVATLAADVDMPPPAVGSSTSELPIPAALMSEVEVEVVEVEMVLGDLPAEVEESLLSSTFTTEDA